MLRSQDVFGPARLRYSSASTPAYDIFLSLDQSPAQPSMRTEGHLQSQSGYAAISISDDNTAAGMALSQEDSMYITPASLPSMLLPDEKESPSTPQIQDHSHDQDLMEEDCAKSTRQAREVDTICSQQTPTASSDEVMAGVDAPTTMLTSPSEIEPFEPIDTDSFQSPTSQHNDRTSASESETATPVPARHEEFPCGLAKIDTLLKRASHIPAWDFSSRKPTMRCPSSLFQPYSKYIGTQQSDRQTYNVEVTILTVDMEQSNMSGYLLIRGLTPEHPMLQTFFTGEIVGGPNQRYSFKTVDPAWGASDKVDLQHWLRFPAWRHLSVHAKKDMNFDFPLDHEPWYTQDHIYMRWKEHFLVPDHKQSNIQGASFEGFYYICFNRVEGKISGVYFHAKSEKYQQLELTHDTKRGLGVFGVSPLVELR